ASALWQSASAGRWWMAATAPQPTTARRNLRSLASIRRDSRIDALPVAAGMFPQRPPRPAPGPPGPQGGPPPGGAAAPPQAAAPLRRAAGAPAGGRSPPPEGYLGPHGGSGSPRGGEQPAP